MANVYQKKIMERFMTVEEVKEFDSKYRSKVKTQGSAWTPSQEDFDFVKTNPSIEQLKTRWDVKSTETILRKLGQLYLSSQK